MMKQGKDRAIRKQQQTNMRYILTEVINTPEGINRSFDTEELTAIWKTEQWKSLKINRKKGKKKIKIKEENLQDFQYSIKHHKIYISWPRRRETEKQEESIFEDMIAEKFPNLRQETGIQARKYRVQNRINPKWTTPRHIVMK